MRIAAIPFYSVERQLRVGEQRLSGSDAKARVRTSREHSRRASLTYAAKSGAGTMLACRKADQPEERDMAEQHKPGAKYQPAARRHHHSKDETT
jgi:hypothetical protein